MLSESKLHTIIEKLDQEELLAQSGLVAYGEIVESSGGFKIQSAHFSPTIFTDYELKIHEVLRGETEADSVCVRVIGGICGGESLAVGGAPELKVGESYLLFLYQPGCGGGYNTEGDYWYVTGNLQGVYHDGTETETLLSQDGEYELSLPQFTELVSVYNEEYPVDLDYNRNRALQALEGNLAEGIYDEAHYNLLLEDMNTYAVIVED